MRTRLRGKTGISEEARKPHDAAKTLSPARTLPAGRGGTAHYAHA